MFLILGPHGNGLLPPKRAEFCLTPLEHVCHHPGSWFLRKFLLLCILTLPFLQTFVLDEYSVGMVNKPRFHVILFHRE